MHKVYNYVDAFKERHNEFPTGDHQILGTNYRLTLINKSELRTSQTPETRSWINLFFGTWIIRPEKNTIIKVELI